ncbi:ATP-binding protein, partial [Planktotalea sp.]|uniref:two-component system sensor histidine kinase NtrB n=1 Tax=Planktotalea sp. TaxID=2029877 RepID=UPI003297BF6A
MAETLDATHLDDLDIKSKGQNNVTLPFLGVMFLTLGFWSPSKVVTLVFLTVAAVLFLGWLLRLSQSFVGKKSNHRELKVAKTLFRKDSRATVISEMDGTVLWRNPVAIDVFSNETYLTRSVSELIKNTLPSSTAIVRRLLAQAVSQGQSRERMFGPNGPLNIQVEKVGTFLLWRFSPEVVLNAPESPETAMLTVGRNDTILYMSPLAKTLIGQRVTSLKRLFSPISSEASGVRTIVTKAGNKQVKIREQILHRDRKHVFLTPVESEAKISEISLSDLPVPLLRLDQQGGLEHANEAALALLGRTNVVGLSLKDIFEGFGQTLEDWIAKTNSHSQTADVEFLRVLGIKKEIFVQVVLKRIGSGKNIKIIALLNDATKLKSLEAQFVQSQKMQAIGQLAGGVAHDFNNLLTAISGHCDLMLLRHDPGDQDYADLMQVHQNANRAAGLVSQLLAFSRKQTLRLEHMDIRNTLSDLTHLLNRLVGETVTLTLSHDPVLKPVRADKRQLEQVIMNLVVNARDAMPNGGEITIETESMTLNSAMRRERVAVPSGDYVVVRVRDEGTGIDPDALQKIFEPFYTTKRTGEGTGLGLSTAYGIVKQTGGYIFVDSEVGSGTCFSLLFPAAENNEKDVETKPVILEDKVKEHSDGVVLLVEDEAPVRAFASRVLSMRGLEVLEAESAEQALEILSDRTLKIDVFVTDVVMPGMDGPTWVRMALEERPDVKVVFVSGYA